MRRFLAPLLIVTVMACDDDPVGPSSNIASIQLSPTDLYVGIGDTTRLSVDARTKDGRTARPEDLAWKSLDTSIAKVDATGLVTGVARGMTRIVASGSGVADTVEVTVLSLRFNVNADNACNAPQYRTGRVVAVGQRSIVVADTANPAGGFTSAEYRSIAQSFDNLIHPTMVRYFGEPEDIDGNRLADHPLISHKLSVLRDRSTPQPTFRLLVDELVTLLAYEATRDVRTEQREVITPVAATMGTHLADPKPIVVPVLRAGLGMLEGMMRLLPTAEVGFLGLRRDEETLEAITYANRLPDDVSGRQCFVLDPMLATGGTLCATIDYLFERGARDVTCICLIAAPEGIETVERHVGDRADVTVVVAAVDERLNDKAYIVPGLGDAGDRLYGLV